LGQQAQRVPLASVVMLDLKVLKVKLDFQDNKEIGVREDSLATADLQV